MKYFQFQQLFGNSVLSIIWSQIGVFPFLYFLTNKNQKHILLCKQ